MNMPARVAMMFVLAACSGAGEADAARLASIEGSPNSGSELVADASVDPEEALLEFAACMRENGFADFPDPEVDSDGNVRIGRAGQEQPDFDPRSEDFRAARDACGQQLEGLVFGPGRGGPGFDDPEFQDRLLEFAACLREGGLEVDDPDFSPAAPGEGGPGGRGLFGGAFDPTDPENRAIIERCQEEVGFFGPGGGPGRPSGEEG